MRTVFLISIGAIVGANARYFVGLWSVERLGSAFPYGTLFINVSGSFLIALLLTLVAERLVPEPATRLLLVTGFCGSYTTFSSYSFEALTLARQGSYDLAALYVLGSVVLCLAAVVAGSVAARLV